MNATNTQAVAKLTANFRKTEYGFIACSPADSAIARTFLPENITRKNGHVCFGTAMLDSFEALAAAAGVKIEVESASRQLKAVA